MTNDSHFSAPTLNYLKQAGWYPKREIQIPFAQEAHIFPAALRVLQEFGNLNIGERGQGINLAKDSVDFRVMYYDWKKGDWHFDYVDELARSIDMRAYPIGFTSNGGNLVVDELGRVFMLGDIDFFVGDSIEEAIEKIINGIKLREIEYKLVDDRWIVTNF